jgi:hypothetical protein
MVGDYSHVVFGKKIPGEKVSVDAATARSYVAKVRDEVFKHFHAVKCHSTMCN